MSIDLNSIDQIITQSPTVGDTLLNYFDYVARELISGTYGTLVRNFQYLLASCMTCVLFIRAILAMAGKFSVQAKEITISIIWMILSIGITAPSFYVSWIIEPLNKFISGLGGILMDTGQMTTFQSVNSMFKEILNLCSIVLSELSWSDVGEILLICLLALIFMVLYAMFIIILVYAKFAVSLFLFFGGVVILLSTFKAFRGMLKSWGVALAKYSFCVIVATLIMRLLSMLCVVAFTRYIKATQDGTTEMFSYNSGFWLLCVGGVVAVFMMWKCFELTSEITGGVGSDMSNSFNAGVNTTKLAIKTMKSKISMGMGKGV